MKSYIRLAACLVAAVATINFGAVSAHAEQSVFVQEEEVTLVAPEPVQEVETPVVEEPTQEAPVVEETPIVEEPIQETPVVEVPTQEVVESAQDVVSTPVVDTQPVVDSSQQTTVETAQPVVSETVVTDTVQTVETVQISEVAEADATPSVTVTQAVVETKTVEAPAVDVKGVRREVDDSTENSSIVEEGEDTSDTVQTTDTSLSVWFVALLAMLLLLIALLYRYKVIVVSDNDNEENTKIYASFKKACEKAKEAEDSEGVVSVTIEAAGLLKLLRKFRNETVERVEVIYNHVLADELYESVYATDSEVDIMEGVLGYYLDRDTANSWILPEELEKIAADQAAEMARIGAENLIEMALDQI